MELRHRRQFAGDQAGKLLAVLAVVVIVLPRLPDGGNLVEVASPITEDQVGTSQKILHILVGKGRVFRQFLRLPMVEKGQQRPGSRLLHRDQQSLVEGLAGLEALQRAFGFALFVCAQDVAGVVAEEVGGHAYGALDRSRQLDGLGYQRLLLPPCHFFLDADYGGDVPLVVQIEHIGHLHRRPAGLGQFPPGGQGLVVGDESLEDHPITSLLSLGGTVRTPSSSTARKNRGRMSCGLE